MDQTARQLGAPLFVTQRTVEIVIGIPPRDYLRAARSKSFASTKERRLIIARTSDVVAWLELRLRTTAGAAPANDADPESIALARVRARRVGA